MKSAAKNIYNIPAGRPFARLLAEYLLQQNDHDRAATLVMLPTRRACRVLHEAFLELREGRALILPRMQPIGDLDEEELSLSILAHADDDNLWTLPPAIPRIKRQMLLAALVQKLHPENTPEQALKLAQALGHLMDQVYTQNLDLKDMATLAPGDFAEHWQITLKFLEILSREWPKILAEEGYLDYADRRNRLILALSAYWQEHPPATPVIGAGSTGSIPATEKLLSTIAGLPQGRIILPGLDTETDGWEALTETHPQYGFKILLQQMGVDHKDIRPFEMLHSDPLNEARQTLAREIMRPADTAQKWATLATDTQICGALKAGLENLQLIECEHGREEADVIALLMRETLNTPEKTACLITPDRALAARVAAACDRWNIAVDDSAGVALNRSKTGIFINLILQAVQDRLSPLSLLAALKHHHCTLQIDIESLDLALRGTKPGAGFSGLRAHIQAQDRLDDSVMHRALEALTQLEPLFEPALALHKKQQGFATFLNTHLTLCEQLSHADTLWAGEQGRIAAGFFAGLFDDAQTMPPLDWENYAAALDHFMAQVPVRPSFGTHPRLQILGQLEARLVDADHVILGGLNEGIWPPEPQVDPWMSRPMRREFGLPGPERSIGLAAHDFVQGLCAPHVTITRALNTDGVPTVPARWLQRLDAVLQAVNLDDSIMRHHDVLHWARSMDKAQTTLSIEQPAPRPPVDKRPRKLSVTQIETWLRDPYSIYAREILGLEPLKPLEKPVDAAERGTMLHKAMEHFIRQTREHLPDNAAQILLDLTQQEIRTRGDDPHIWSFWWPRFAKSAHWLAAQEAAWRTEYTNIAAETRGEHTMNTPAGPFTLSARIDRIDAHMNGEAAIIDYKSGGQYSIAGLKDGRHPQLPLEALILREGGFADQHSRETRTLQYWVFSGTGGGRITALEDDIPALVETTAENLRRLVESYDSADMPYISIPRPGEKPRFNDYEHLARIREWAATGDEDESEAA